MMSGIAALVFIAIIAALVVPEAAPLRDPEHRFGDPFPVHQGYRADHHPVLHRRHYLWRSHQTDPSAGRYSHHLLDPMKAWRVLS